MRFLPAAVCCFCAAAPAFGQYTGPAVLSRGEAPAAMSMPSIPFRPFVDLGATYDTGLSNVNLNDQGQLANAGSAGASIGWGVSGFHSWKHDKLGLDYRGDFIHYGADSGYDSIDQSLLLGYTHQFSKYVILNLRESAGVFKRDFGLLNLPQTVPFDPSSSFIPTTDYFDNRTYYFTTHADLLYQRTARLSFDFSGDGFLTRRQSTALYGVNGALARGDVQYRVSSHTTIGVSYSYMHSEYTRFFGTSDAHSVAGVFSKRLSRRTEFSGYAGIWHVESKYLRSVPIDPVIAALLGITTGSQIVHPIDNVPNLGARFSRTFRTGVLYLSAGHSVTPGNGVFDTSYGTYVGGGYSYTGLRRWSFGASVDYSRARSVGTINGIYGGWGAGATVSRSVTRMAHFVAGYRVRQYGSPDYSNYNRWIYEAHVGIGFSPGEVPLRIW